jgi:thiol-disulfide isomerase/thioredoxin
MFRHARQSRGAAEVGAVMNRSRLLILAIILCGAGASLGGLALWLFPLSHVPEPTGNAVSGLGQFIAADPPRPAPELAFDDGTGKTVTLADFRGRVVLVNLWATWCEPCVREMPALDRLEAAMGSKDFAVILVSQDRGGAHVVEPFFAKLGLTSLRTYLDPKGIVGRGFGVRGLPTTILLDRDGAELGRTEGGTDWDGAAAAALIRRYVEKKAAAN